MQYFNNILTVEAGWMIEQGLMSDFQYRHLSTRGDIQVVRRGCRNTPALVAYESLPERFKKQIAAKIDVYKAAKVNMIEQHIVHSAEASAFFDGYMLKGDRHLPVDKRREYYADAIVLDAIHSIIVERNGKRHALSHRSSARNWDELADSAQNLDRCRYPHMLPANPRSLERKYKQYKKEGYASLIHKAYINNSKNAGKVIDDNQVSTLAMLMSDPRNLDNAQVARIYNTLAVQMKWKKITASTVAVWREKLDDEIYARRHGSAAYQNNKAMQVKRRPPQYPLYYWTIDGWDVELMYQKTEIDKNSHSITTYHNRPTVIVVLDPCCKYPVGYAIGDHETPELIKEALRNAARHTESLFGRMYRTAQLQSDNYAISLMLPLYRGMADKATPARKGNAKAKIIEPWFKYLNKKYCQLQINWSGYGVTSKKENQPNADFLNRYRHNFPDYEGVCAQIVMSIEAERAELHDKYMALWNDMPEENRFPLSVEQYLLMFGATTDKRHLLQGNGITVTIGGKRHSYDCFNPSFRKHASVRWEVRYDPDDLSRVLAVSEDESLQYELEEKYIQPMALIERTEGDSEQLQRVLRFNMEQERRITEQMCDYSDKAAELLSEHSKELDTLQKLLIVDSNGQHKDQRNRARLKDGYTGHDATGTEDDELLDEY